ncbi:hypothetical protein SAY87_022081 [Trapa incisa]|uniref:Uncharacterized protein n=1 Tax=Trapa incisa TaxID=236973 RepID=A0AAN7JSS7_9MYRT|nr:hypothetical protein SAY87_022081 [Trapa incisa]
MQDLEKYLQKPRLPSSSTSFSHVTVRIVNAQLERYIKEAHLELNEFLRKHSLNDGESASEAHIPQMRYNMKFND